MNQQGKTELQSKRGKKEKKKNLVYGDGVKAGRRT